jgi:hypothetical protein
MKTRKLWEPNSQEEQVQIHPASVLYNKATFKHPFLVFHEKVMTSQVYVRDATAVSPFALLLFGGAGDLPHRQSPTRVPASFVSHPSVFHHYRCCGPCSSERCGGSGRALSRCAPLRPAQHHSDSTALPCDVL